ncbi:MAG: protein translocase subunit SecD, partial [bacterium]|nr:protein translocase subunit SecD [bacterium]
EELQRDPTEEELAQLTELNTAEEAAAKDVLNLALAGTNFDDLVAQYSVETNKDETQGIIENITSDAIRNSEYAILIEDKFMWPGQVYSNTLISDEDISVWKYLSKGESAEMELSHILICYEGTIGCETGLPEIDASLQMSSIMDQVTGENFADLAKQYSTGPSGPEGGYLGWGKADNYVASFGLAAAALEVGEVSDVVKTEFGYHLIYKSDQKLTDAYTVQRIVMNWTDILDIVPDVEPWVNTELSGKYLERAVMEFDQTTGEPYVTLDFNGEGGDLFATLTEENIGLPIAIFLDGEAISTPVVQTAIYGGRAVITGDFTREEAKLLAQRLNAGALPVSIELLSQQTVGPTLGAVSLEKSINAALFGFLLVAIYMVLVYRFTGFIAVMALFLFAFLNLAAYRLFGVTITLAGIAGFVLSLGIAVDANVLIIERFKEEYAAGRDFIGAADEAVKRAWTAIRDGNLTTLIAAAVLYWFSSSFIRGFALTLSIGVILSMFTAITVTRAYLHTILEWKKIRKPALFGVKRK